MDENLINGKSLAHYLRNPVALREVERDEILREIARYPYSAHLHLIISIKEYLEEGVVNPELLERAALYISDRKKLGAWVNKLQTVRKQRASYGEDQLNSLYDTISEKGTAEEPNEAVAPEEISDEIDKTTRTELPDIDYSKTSFPDTQLVDSAFEDGEIKEDKQPDELSEQSETTEQVDESVVDEPSETLGGVHSDGLEDEQTVTTPEEEEEEEEEVLETTSELTTDERLGEEFVNDVLDDVDQAVPEMDQEIDQELTDLEEDAGEVDADLDIVDENRESEDVTESDGDPSASSAISIADDSGQPVEMTADLIQSNGDDRNGVRDETSTKEEAEADPSFLESEPTDQEDSFAQWLQKLDKKVSTRDQDLEKGVKTKKEKSSKKD